MPKVATVLTDDRSSDNLKVIHYWAARPSEPHAARMIFSEADRLLERLRTHLDAA